MKGALEHCRKHLGDNITILYDPLPDAMKITVKKSIKKLVIEQGKDKRGPWERHLASQFYGWEAEKVVAVINGESNYVEQITRARTHLAVILLGERYNRDYLNIRRHFRQAANEGLVDIVHLSAN